MKKLIALVLIIVIILTIVVYYYPIRSYIVMGIYSAIEKNKSIMNQNGYRIQMDSDDMWYPFVITFNPIHFGKWSGTDADMSIMYNFGKFDPSTKTSIMYDKSSPYYSAFYGAYALTIDDDVYGFEGDMVNVDQLIRAFEYDYKYLVLDSIGCSSATFDVLDYDTQSIDSYIGYDNWVCIDADISTNGVAHSYEQDYTAYIQYGEPLGSDDDFAVSTMHGRLYARYFPQYNSTIVIYIMAQDMDVVSECDADILSETQIVSIQPSIISPPLPFRPK